MTRADLEDEQRQQRIRDGLDPDPELAQRAARRSGGPAEDGSFSRPGADCTSRPHLQGLWDLLKTNRMYIGTGLFASPGCFCILCSVRGPKDWRNLTGRVLDRLLRHPEQVRWWRQSLQQKYKEGASLQGGAAETSPRRLGWGMGARRRAHREARATPMTRTAASELTLTMSSLPGTEPGRRPLRRPEGASLGLMCDMPLAEECLHRQIAGRRMQSQGVTKVLCAASPDVTACDRCA